VGRIESGVWVSGSFPILRNALNARHEFDVVQVGGVTGVGTENIIKSKDGK